ncbi:MAG TPA: rhomboid family intramembrane serine protease [Candidatus Xenobia bacterium]|nr:rhomboid family intramembrane serine protease [Candidatus Xenobia bacterium]
MIPLRDANPSRRWPLITLLVILANALIFLYEVTLGPAQLQQFVFTFGVVPARLTGAAPPALPAGGGIETLLTSMFLHAGWLHLIGNMWFLWIFGDNVEDYLGHLRFLLFYLFCGLAAGLIHIVFNLSSMLPTVGASGAIAGVLGAYLLLFPRARILTLVPVFFVFLMEIPAYVILIYWFVLQFLSGTVSIVEGSAAQGGVAWWAHVGGFVVGLALVKLLAPRQRYSIRYR